MATLPLHAHPSAPPSSKQNWGSLPSTAYFVRLPGRSLHALEILWQFAAPTSPIVYDAIKRLACCPNWGKRSAQNAVGHLIERGFAKRPCERSKDLALLRPTSQATLNTKRMCGDWVRTPARSAIDARLTPGDRIVLGFLRSYANADGESYWFNADIAEMLSLSRRQVRRSKRALCALGYITLTPRPRSSDIVHLRPVADLDVRRLIKAALRVAETRKQNERSKKETRAVEESTHRSAEGGAQILDFVFKIEGNAEPASIPSPVRSNTISCPVKHHLLSGLPI